MTKKWNPGEHHVTWQRILHPDNTFTYLLKCDGDAIYCMDGSTEGKTTMELLAMHSQFIDLTEYYQKNGQLPGRFSRGMLKKKPMMS